MTRIIFLPLLMFMALLTACVERPTPRATLSAGLPTATPTAAAFPGCIAPDAPVSSGRVVKVTDGDTIHVVIDGKEYTVRYVSIDAPEDTNRVDPYGREASALNRSLVEGQRVTLVKDVSETDRFGRLLRYVFVGATFVNDEMVRQGYAHAASYPPDVACLQAFREAEDAARSAGRGLWADQERAAPCDCAGRDLDCGDFLTRAGAQTCFEYCRAKGLGDVFFLDGDGNGLVCERAP